MPRSRWARNCWRKAQPGGIRRYLRRRLCAEHDAQNLCALPPPVSKLFWTARAPFARRRMLAVALHVALRTRARRAARKMLRRRTIASGKQISHLYRNYLSASQTNVQLFGKRSWKIWAGGGVVVWRATKASNMLRV